MTDSSLPRLLRGARGAPLTLDEHEAAFPDSRPTGSLLDQRSTPRASPDAAAPLFRQRPRRAPSTASAHAPRSSSSTPWRASRPPARTPRSCRRTPTSCSTGPRHSPGRSERRTSSCACRPPGRRLVAAVESAVDERRVRGRSRVQFRVASPPERYISGEESALTHWLSDGVADPTYRPERPHTLTVQGAPTLVDNAETCAHVALIERYGADWFRAVGTPQSPGSALVTVSGALERPVVLEVALGTPLARIIESAGAPRAPPGNSPRRIRRFVARRRPRRAALRR